MTCPNTAGQLVCVDFTATWCGPCKKIGPKFVEMAGIYEDCQFVKVDVDENEETTTACNVTNMPTFQFYKVISCSARPHHHPPSQRPLSQTQRCAYKLAHWHVWY